MFMKRLKWIKHRRRQCD